jgi:acetyl-CoA carboxylase biotin carboxyl carrier protein
VARGRSDKRSKRPPAGAAKAARAARPAAPGRAAGAGRAARRNPAFTEIEQLVELMDRHGLVEVDFESARDGTRRFRVSRAAGASLASAPAAPTAGVVRATHAADAAPGPAAAAEPAAPIDHERLHTFKSPMVGTFYRAPSPEAPPFASVGDKVDEHSTVCIIEAMKVMNEITPDTAGEIVSIEVENGEAVEYGQPLFLIRPV